MAGEYIWENKKSQNTRLKIVKNTHCKLIALPPKLCDLDKQKHDEDVKEWFWIGENGLEVKIFDNPCGTCGSPCCFFQKNKSKLKQIVKKAEKIDTKSNESKRYQCYNDGAVQCGLNQGEGIRSRLGFCFVNLVRTKFPSEEYTGFRYSERQKKYGV